MVEALRDNLGAGLPYIGKRCNREAVCCEHALQHGPLAERRVNKQKFGALRHGAYS